jgi:FkbM family methyltransferase
LPGFHCAYKLPTLGNIYIDITESPMMFARVCGKYEPEKHRALDFFLAYGDAFIDIGANKGDFAIHASILVGPTGRVIAFEPEPENCKWIRKSIEKSNVKNIVLEEAAIGETKGDLQLFLGKKSGWHSFVPNQQNQNKKPIIVKVHSLDEYMAERPALNLKVIKIDVEGFEKQVLLGAEKTLGQSGELILLVDIHPSHGVNHDEIFGILRELGFSLFEEQYPFISPLYDGKRPLSVVAVKGR